MADNEGLLTTHEGHKSMCGLPVGTFKVINVLICIDSENLLGSSAGGGGYMGPGSDQGGSDSFAIKKQKIIGGRAGLGQVLSSW